jgi:glucan phosphoethanolaminetransferase (alkaline phosphatase superfamily)
MRRWLLLLLIVAAAVAFVVVPFFLIQPFRPQTETGLAAGYYVRGLAPWATVALALGALVLVVMMWRASRRWWAKVLMVLLLLPVGASVWASRQNIYEVMFNPLAAPAYARAAEVDYISDEDMVLAVERGGERVAYPVRLMAYHHLVADAVGGVPIVATY